MLEQVCDYIHNYFEKEIYRGRYEISDGNIVTDKLASGQYFRIKGSIFNDGIHQYPAEDLTAETFSGELWAMAVPPSVIALVGEIEAWKDKYEEQLLSPYTSESFGGYSYTKASGSSSDGRNNPYGWQDVFRSRLNHWRKIS